MLRLDGGSHHGGSRRREAVAVEPEQDQEPGLEAQHVHLGQPAGPPLATAVVQSCTGEGCG